MRGREQAASQRTDPESQDSCTPPQTDEQILYEAVGKRDKKGRVYGFGSQASHFFGSIDGAGSSRGPQYGPHEDSQLRQDYERLQAELLRNAEENAQLRQTVSTLGQQQQDMREEMARQQAEMQAQLTAQMQAQYAQLEALLISRQGGFSSHQQQPTASPVRRAQPGIFIRDDYVPAPNQHAAEGEDEDEAFVDLPDLHGSAGRR